jgi:hypothetical protein
MPAARWANRAPKRLTIPATELRTKAGDWLCVAGFVGFGSRNDNGLIHRALTAAEPGPISPHLDCCNMYKLSLSEGTAGA